MESFLGYDVHDGGLDATVDEIVVAINARSGRFSLACINPHSFVIARKDEEFQKALRAATWLIPDGAGIVLASRILGGSLRGRVSGPDVFALLHARLEKRGGARIFFLGASNATLQRISSQLRKDHPGLVVAGMFSPPFTSRYDAFQNSRMVEIVNSANPDVLWVAMTAPKQEKWLYENRSALNVPFAGAVGAVFDFYAGSAKRSSPFFQRLGLEWLPRLLREPSRLWRRTFVSAPIFLSVVIVARFRRWAGLG